MKQEPRGIRNNNPGNIRFAGGVKWKGIATPPSDGAFCRFVSPEMGLRAVFRILRTCRRRGVVTLEAIVRSWAPPSENDTAAYIRSVARETGFAPEDQIDVTERDEAVALARALVLHENGPGPSERGRSWYPLETYIAAFEAAGGAA